MTFAFENKVEYERFVAYLKEGKLGEAHKLLKKNIEDVWYQEDSEVSTFWKLAGYALQIADCVNRGVKSDGDIQDLVEWYVGSGQEADKAYRRYLTDSQEVVSLPAAVKTMTQYVEGLYADFTERSVKEYQMRAGEIKNHEQLRNQGCIDMRALKKVPNFKLHSLFLNFNSCPRSISSFKSGILFWTGI